MDIKALLVFGPPGVGKGTLCQFLTLSGDFVQISSGEIFRSLDANNPHAQEVQEHASQGLLLPDKLVMKIWHQHLLSLIAKKAFDPNKQILLLDGIPRTPVQAEMLKEYLEVLGVISLEVKQRETLLKRLHSRALLEGRSDDAKEEIIEKRLSIYEKETKAVLNIYPRKILSIQAQQSRLSVLRDTLIALTPFL